MKTRLIIYPKDIQAITGKTYAASHKMLQRIRKHYSKASHHLVTIDEFCQYMGLRTPDVLAVIR